MNTSLVVHGTALKLAPTKSLAHFFLNLVKISWAYESDFIVFLEAGSESSNMT